MDWDKLKIFHAVAEAGSFTNATINLNLSQSAISRQIQSLEQDLKVQLFERHARGLTLTENGEYVFKTAHEVISKLKEVETSLGDQKNKPTGKLTITTVRSFGTHWLTPRIQEFMRLNPEIEIELIFGDKELNLSTRQADIGIFMRRPKQLNYIQKKLIDIKAKYTAIPLGLSESEREEFLRSTMERKIEKLEPKIEENVETIEKQLEDQSNLPQPIKPAAPFLPDPEIANMFASNISPTTNLTRTEEALLSPTEQIIRQRLRT